MARLEEAEHGPGEEMRAWLDRAVTAMPDPRYICTGCGGESLEWRSRCPHCGRFDTLLWRTPAWVAGGAVLPAIAETVASQVRELAAGDTASD
jgi:HemY protein